ncbi:MAG: hypothetical protein ABEL04_05240 [Salinibacter sp.]|uniref:hypothetical protein n=1 Tax=Salinibacter sp. TaxID=2065818 RepID=UPI0035D41218
MGLFTGIWVVVLGTLGGSSFIVSRRPDAQEVIDQLAPYQGWIGAISALWGGFTLVSQLLNLGSMAGAPLVWWTMTANGAVLLALGLLLGVGVLKSFDYGAEAKEKIDQTVQALSPYQVTLGLVGIGLGIWTLVYSLLL